MSESKNAAEEQTQAVRTKTNKKKAPASTKPATTMATMQEIFAEADKLRQRAIILETLASTCVELFARIGDDREPKYFIHQQNGSAAVANLDLVLEVNSELILAAHVTRERLRSLMGISVPLALTEPLPALTEQIEPPPPGEGPPHDPSETVVPNPHRSQRY